MPLIFPQSIIFVLGASILLTACAKEEPLTFDSSNNGVYFNYQRVEDLKTDVNFADHLLENSDTVKINVSLKWLGIAPSMPTTVVLRQRPIKDVEVTKVSIPSIEFPAGAYEHTVTIGVPRPKLLDVVYGTELYLDATSEQSEAANGIGGFETYAIRVSESYSEPPYWQYEAGIYFGTWTPEKHVFLTRLTQNTTYYSAGWDKYPQFSRQAVDSLRKYQELNPEATDVIDLPFSTDVRYEQPFFWSDLHNRYLGQYSSGLYVGLCRALGVTTANEKSFFMGEEARLKELNVNAVQTMMRRYNTLFSWQYNASDYRKELWVPIFSGVDYPVVKPIAWNGASAALLEKYYGEYSDEKYKFMISAMLAAKGTDNFVLVELFPVQVVWTDSGTQESRWDTSIGGESKIRECYRIIREAYDENPSAYNFDFPVIF